MGGRAGQRGLAGTGAGRHAAGRRNAAGGAQELGLRLQLAVLEPDEADERRDHDQDSEDCEDVSPRRVPRPECPEGGNVLGPFVVREAVDHDILLSADALRPFASANASSKTGADSTSSPLGSAIVSGTRSNSGKKSAWNSAMSRPSSSTSGGTRSRLALFSSQLTMKAGRKASGKNASMPMS